MTNATGLPTAGHVNASVTYAKIQNVAASSLLGNPTGSVAAPSEITLGAGLSFSGTTLVSSGSATGVGVQGGQAVSNIGDNATALPAAHFVYATNANMTAARSHNLPDSTTQGVGDIEVIDTQQTITGTNTLTLAAAGTDQLNGVTNGTVVLRVAGSSIFMHNDGAGHYTTGPAAVLPTPTASSILQTNASSVPAWVPLPQFERSVGWLATVNPNNVMIFIAKSASTVTSIVGNVETATGGTATVSVFKAPSGTACSGGTVLHSGSFNANGTAATNQTLTLTTTALAAGDRVCLQTTGTTTWTSGTGIGGITVAITTP